MFKLIFIHKVFTYVFKNNDQFSLLKSYLLTIILKIHMKVIYITLQVKMGPQKEKLGYRGEGTLLL
jgi:hypothetical protein